MNALALIARAFAPLVRAAEGAFRPGPYFLPITGGWLPAGAPINWWQTGISPTGQSSQSAMVEACVSAYSQTVATCPGGHWELNEKQGHDRVTNSALARILRSPNSYQSISDFLLNAIRSLYLDGNVYALALRNNRFEIDELHLMSSSSSVARIAATGEVFYSLAGNPIIDRQLAGAALLVPARDVLHIKLHTTRDPLKGESPLVAAYLDISAGDAIKNQQIAFYLNQGRPSFVLGSDQVITPERAAKARIRWEEQCKGLNQGGVPILSEGLKPLPLSTSAKDAELAEIMKLSDQNIALVFRVPLQMLGLGGTPFASTEALMQFWLASGLGFCLNHVEEAFGQLFALRGYPDEYVEFDTRALLRSAEKDRIEALARAVQGGIKSPNEARAEEGLEEVEFGDEPRCQSQVVPLSAASGIPSAPAAPASPAAPVGDQKPPEPEKIFMMPVTRSESDMIISRAARFM